MLHQGKCLKILQQIVAEVSPIKVLVFGSSVNGKPRANDLDFLIVIRDEADPREIARNLYRKIDRNGISIDLVVVTEGEYEMQRESFWSVVGVAQREGKEIYVAKTA